VPSVLRFADLLAVLLQLTFQDTLRLWRYLLHQALNDVISKLMLGESDEAELMDEYLFAGWRTRASFYRY